MASVLEAGFRNSATPTANSIDMGDSVTITVDSSTTLTGVIQHFDFDTNALMLVQTVDGSPVLTVVKDYKYFIKN